MIMLPVVGSARERRTLAGAKGKGMEYHFRVHEGEDGLWAECIELSGCVTQGDDRAELERNAREALSAYLDEPAGTGVDIPLPQEKVRGDAVFGIELSPEIAFGLVLRHY